MSDLKKESDATVEKQPEAASAPVAESVSSNPMEEVDSGEETENRLVEQETPGNPMDELDTEGEDGDTISPVATVVPSNTPVTGDSGQGSPTMQSSSESLSDDAQPAESKDENQEAAGDSAAQKALGEDTKTEAAAALVSSKEEAKAKLNGSSTAEVKGKTGKEAKKEEKKEEKKKSKKKEDKGIEYILRALNSLQSPEEKLAALCKKYADLHEEHRVLQSSVKTQQRTMTVVMREKDQLQTEHTKAMMAKSKLESLCRELQKHNKMIKDESLKRAKEDDEKRKDISAHFTTTIGEIQTQMNANSETNARLREENETMAKQLRVCLQASEMRDEQVKKLQTQHDLEKKLAEAKLAQAQAILREHEEKGAKEKELLLLKLAESGKRNAVLEAQVSMFKERYDDFEKLHTRSSETFQKYKTEMDKMTKRIKKLEKDGLSWKAKWEGTNKALIEQMEERNKSEKEALLYIQKTKKLESLCRALQAELHGKKVDIPNDTGEEGKSNDVSQDNTPPTSTAPPNSPDASSSDQCSPDTSVPQNSSLSAEESKQAQLHPTEAGGQPLVLPSSTASPFAESTSTSSSSPLKETAAVTTAVDQSQGPSKDEAPSISASGGAAVSPSASSSPSNPPMSSSSPGEASENLAAACPPSEVAA